MESQVIHVLLVSGHDPVVDWLLSTLRSEAGIVLVSWLPTLERASELIGQRQVDVILLDTSAPDAQRLERMQAMTAGPTSPALILMVDPAEMTFVQQALFAGARGFLLKPFTERHLIESLHQTFSLVVQQRQASGTARPSVEARAGAAEILAVYSPKGGVGCTALATSLAVALHQDAHKRVTLVDGDLQFGDVDIAMNAIAHTSVADLLNYVNDLEPSLVESVLVEHPSGVRLLLAPQYFDPAMEVSEGRLPHVIKTLASAQEGHVVIDAPSGLGELALGLLDVAHRVLLVTTPTLASLRATKRFMELAAKMSYPPEKIALVLNDYRRDVPIETIERHLNWPVAAIVPSDPLAVALSLNQGQPIVYRDRNHAISKAIVKLARQLAGGLSEDAAQYDASQLNLPAEKRGSAQITRFALNPQQVWGTPG
jgi:pilus assembly protein CpaE